MSKYPPFFDSALLGLDPLFSTALKLFAKAILDLKPLPDQPDLYVLNQCHVIRYAEVCGVIVSVEQTYNTIIYTLDDATGTLQCCQWKNQGKIIKPLALGTTVCVRGRINDFRDARQINIQRLDVIDQNRQLMHDIWAARLLETTYAEPPMIPQDIIDDTKEIKKELQQHMDENWTDFLASSQQQAAIVKDEKYFKQEMLEFLRSTSGEGPFSKTKPRGHKPLHTLARQVITQHQKETATSQNIGTLFKNTIGALLKEGWVVESTSGGTDMFLLVDDVKLETCIINIIKDAIQALPPRYQNGGIMLDYIIIKVQKQDPYTKLPRDRIVRCIDSMVTRSILYNTRAREYKPC
ncbi:hypothetical protein O0I10_010560 [Lichtheimia ornata]|uniref:CST complex subunit STN1 n=1 Tax=Lichtheimia ornata TaxID=688661 RepID=A0AAD7UVH1_9FUNG|nr:uncharacterized protein O0I10_010560 [Lichtheimia ornata]KAJ8653761.1 hypothetical protein O0I10_010560 [Lichtheimia ornata]